MVVSGISAVRRSRSRSSSTKASAAASCGAGAGTAGTLLSKARRLAGCRGPTSAF
jgi:hypothetical protein